MDNTKDYLSKEKYEELEAELKELKLVARKEVAEHLEYAKSLGDLSENAEYHEARDKQADIEDRISQIESILKNAVLIKGHHGATVSLGSKVTVKRADGETGEYQVVGSEEADMQAGKISHQSPIGAALIGHTKGDKVVVITPRGEVAYSILEVK